MFENIRKVLDDYEQADKECKIAFGEDLTEDVIDCITYFHVNLAKAIMKDFEDWDRVDEKIAKIILAAKGLSNDISVKIE